ncbi:hypothetical protein Tco_0710176 [Tanacetum coccineum]
MLQNVTVGEEERFKAECAHLKGGLTTTVDRRKRRPKNGPKKNELSQKQKRRQVITHKKRWKQKGVIYKPTRFKRDVSRRSYRKIKDIEGEKHMILEGSFNQLIDPMALVSNASGFSNIQLNHLSLHNSTNQPSHLLIYCQMDTEALTTDKLIESLNQHSCPPQNSLLSKEQSSQFKMDRGEHVTNFDDDVDDLALHVDHVFEADPMRCIRLLLLMWL